MDFINEHKNKIFLGLVILLIIVAVITGVGKFKPKFLSDVLGFVFVPIQKVIGSGTESVGSLFDKKKDAETLRQENAKLREEISLLTDENKRLSLFEEENVELSKLLDINRKYPDYEKMGVQILSKDISNWHNVFTVDKGERDGVKEDMFVIAEGGLVGRVFEVYDKFSKVMPIIDDRSAVHGQSLQTDDIGVVRGDTYLMQQGLCLMEYIDIEAEMSVGDEIITSVFSEIYPAGITIGYVKEIRPSADGLTKSAVITPGANFNNLSKAIVLTNRKGG